MVLFFQWNKLFHCFFFSFKKNVDSLNAFTLYLYILLVLLLQVQSEQQQQQQQQQYNSHGMRYRSHLCMIKMGMLTLELFFYWLEIPNDAYSTLRQYDWLFNTQSRVLQADWFILEINEKATLNINMPLLFQEHVCIAVIRSWYGKCENHSSSSTCTGTGTLWLVSNTWLNTCTERFNIKISYFWSTHTCKAKSLFDDSPLSCFSAKWRWYVLRRLRRFDLALAAADLGLRGIVTNNDHQPMRVVKRFPSQDRSTSEQAAKETNRN